MNDLLGYLLNLDELDERQRLEELLRNDPSAARQLALLRRALEPLETDRDAFAPPSDLVARTIGRIAEHVCAGGAAPAVAANGPPMEDLLARLTPEKWRNIVATLDRPEPSSSRWRRADFVVVASIVVVGFGLLLGALPYLRHRQNLTACQNHLRKLYQSLDAYAEFHQNRYPQITEAPPNNSAASFVSELAQAGVAPDPPDSGFPRGPPRRRPHHAQPRPPQRAKRPLHRRQRPLLHHCQRRRERGRYLP